MKKAFMYRRVSTAQQVEKFGLPAQEDEIKSYCIENGIEIVGSFVDEGITGKIAEREGIAEMLAAFEDNPDVKYVIVANTSRLWRSDIAGGLIRYQLSKLKVDIISVQEPNYSLYIDNPSDFLIGQIMQALATYDRMQINLKLANARRVKAKTGGKPCGSLPYGYIWQSRKVVIDYNNHIVVQDIFRKFVETGSYAKVERHCEAMGYKTRSGKSFTRQHISNMLHNDFYIGIVTHAGEKSQGTHTPIIDMELWNAVQSRFDK